MPPDSELSHFGSACQCRYTCRMRVALDARLNGYRDGGIAQYTRCLIDALARLDTSGDYRILYAARPLLRHDSDDNLMPTESFRRVPIFTPPHHRFERIAL